MFKNIPLRTLTPLLLVLGFAGLSAPLQAGTVGFPKDKPVGTVEVPAGWETNYFASSGTVQVSQMMVGQLNFIPLPADAGVTDDASAKAALVKVATDHLKGSTTGDVKCTPPVESAVAGNKAYSTKATAGTDSNDYTIFTPDGETWFLMQIQDDGKKLVPTIKAAS